MITRALLLSLLWCGACQKDAKLAHPELFARDASEEEPDAAANDPADASTTCKLGLPERAKCPTIARALSVQGQSPLGPVEIQSAGVDYWMGYTNGTRVWFEGVAAGHELHLQAVIVTTDQRDAPMAAPGSYGLDNPNQLDSRYLASAWICEELRDLQGTTLRIDTHTSPPGAPFEAGSAVDLRGTFTVTDPGWQLTIPFVLSQVCDRWTDL